MEKINVRREAISQGNLQSHEESFINDLSKRDSHYSTFSKRKRNFTSTKSQCFYIVREKSTEINGNINNSKEKMETGSHKDIALSIRDDLIEDKFFEFSTEGNRMSDVAATVERLKKRRNALCSELFRRSVEHPNATQMPLKRNNSN